ncbi:hypothetical protein CI610_02304 [invertebrate metagenome]|uniref:DUF4124 domain-containing protein n=1 Tax=invertebrate metagenome TaxID=1711999 RepID=A0A2H9T696_9ZZZZ
MSYFNAVLLIILLYLSGTTAVSAVQRIFTWTDDKGVQHYSHTPESNIISRPDIDTDKESTHNDPDLFRQFTPTPLAANEKLTRLQGSWEQVAMEPSIRHLMINVIPSYGIAMEDIPPPPVYASKLTVKDNTLTLTSVPDKQSPQKIRQSISTEGQLEMKKNTPIELQSHWLFEENNNPFLYNFAMTILGEFIDKDKLSAVYQNNERIKVDLQDEHMVITVYPKAIAQLSEARLLYKRMPKAQSAQPE